MNNFQVSTEQRALLTNELERCEVTDLAQPISDGNETTGHCGKKQLLLDEIEELKIRRDKYLSEAEQLYTEMAPLEALLESDEVMDTHRQYEVQKQYNDLKRPYDSRKHHASIIASQITRRENLANHETLMAGYTEAMANWKPTSKNSTKSGTVSVAVWNRFGGKQTSIWHQPEKPKPMQQPPMPKPWHGVTRKAKKMPVQTHKRLRKILQLQPSTIVDST